jgi:AraC-like DNA-binding protein
MTLFDYLLYYRIQQSLPLLKGGGSITDIAGTVGFSNPCYYGKIFRRYMNCSPREYRQNS